VLLREVEYARPTSIEQALQLLGANDGARALAGGQTIVNVMKARAASPDVLVDLNKLDELRTVSRAPDGGLELGAMLTYAQLARDGDVAAARPILRDVCLQIADVQVRNRGTIGGNVCSNDPTNHLPPLLTALGATMTIRGPEGERTVPAEEFFLGVYMTAVATGELLTSITVPPGGRDGFASITIGADGTCIVSAAANLDGEPILAIGCVSAVPVVVHPGSTDEQAVREAVRGAVTDPPADVHASAEYRLHLAEVLAVRAVASASERS
jgi:aerobic carbon-monoxide dehydrogenase medium subunit